MDCKINIGCVILAAGHSVRFGENDKLISLLGGRKLIEWVLSVIPTSSFSKVCAVTSSADVADVCRLNGYETVIYGGGELSDSIRRGMSAMPDDADGIMFLNADRPFIKSETITRMVEAFAREPAKAVRLTYDGVPSNPVIFPRRAFEQLRALEGDRGGGYVLKKGGIEIIAVEAERIEETYDADDPDTLERMNEMLLK